STNSGAVWIKTTAPIQSWWSATCSADGTKLAASVSGGQIYTSTDSGATWIPNGVSNLNWGPIAGSADGASLVAAIFYPGTGGIYSLRLTPQPKLSLKPSGNGALVSWVVPSMDFALQESADLTSASWTNLKAGPVLNLTNLQDELILPFTTNKRFY